MVYYIDRVGKRTVVTTVGAILGSVLGLYNLRDAHFYMENNPEIGDIGVTDALFANRFLEWFYFNYPFVGLGVTIGITTMLCLLSWKVGELSA